MRLPLWASGDKKSLGQFVPGYSCHLSLCKLHGEMEQQTEARKRRQLKAKGKLEQKVMKRPIKNRRIRVSCWKIALLPSALRAAGNLRDIFSCTFYTMENPWSCFVYEATECSYSKMSFQTSGIWWKENTLFISSQASGFSALQIFFLCEWTRSTNFPPYLQI